MTKTMNITAALALCLAVLFAPSFSEGQEYTVSVESFSVTEEGLPVAEAVISGQDGNLHFPLSAPATISVTRFVNDSGGLGRLALEADISPASDATPIAQSYTVTATSFAAPPEGDAVSMILANALILPAQVQPPDPPGEPEGYSPRNGEIINSKTVDFEWPVTPGVSHYTVLVDTENPPSLSSPEDSFLTFTGENGVTHTSAYAYPLDGQTRYWIVYPDTNLGNGSPVISFVSGDGTPPVEPTVTSPADESESEVGAGIGLQWTIGDANRTITHDVQVLKGGSPVVEIAGIAGTATSRFLAWATLDAAGVEAGDDIECQVRAVNGAGGSEWVGVTVSIVAAP